MKVKITDEMGKNNKKEIEIEKISVKDLLKHFKINPFAAIVMKNGEIVRESEILTNENEIKLLMSFMADRD